MLALSAMRARVAAAVLCAALGGAAFPLLAVDPAAARRAPKPASSQPQAEPTAKAQAKPTAKAQAKPTQKPGAQGRRGVPKEVSPAPAEPAAQPQDSANCTVDGMADTGPVTYTVPIPAPGSKRRVAACLMTPKQAIALHGKRSLFVVDVRSASAYDRYRIPGAMNIPLSFVKTKTFLKDQPFALVDATPGSGELERACQAMREAGFKRAAVVRGGLTGWRAAGGGIEGDLLAQRELNRMPPAAFAEEGAYADWLVLSVANVPQAELGKFLPGALALRGGADGTSFAAELKAAVGRRTRKGAELNLLVVDDDGSRIEKLETLIPAGLPGPVVFLDGGLAGYRKFWADQAAIWAATERGLRPPRCGA